MSRRLVAAATKIAPLLAALGDDKRLAIITRLSAEGPLTTVQITDGQDVTRQAIAKHLEVLSKAKLVRSARQGRERVWSLDARALAAAAGHLAEVGALAAVPPRGRR